MKSEHNSARPSLLFQRNELHNSRNSENYSWCAIDFTAFTRYCEQRCYIYNIFHCELGSNIKQHECY